MRGPDLFTYAAADLARYETRPKKAIRAELIAPADAGMYWCICGGCLGPSATGRCDRCGT